jgi:hypothetical protein
MDNNIHGSNESPNGESATLVVGAMPFIQKAMLDFMPPLGTLSKLHASTNHYIH